MVWVECQALKFYASWGIMVGTLCQGVGVLRVWVDSNDWVWSRGWSFTRRIVGWVLGFTRLWGVKKLKKVVESGCGLVRLWVQ